MRREQRNTEGKRKERIANIYLLIATLGLCFLVTEVVLRIVWRVPDSYGYPKGLYLSDKTKGYKYKPNFFGKYPGEAYSDIEIRINSHGLRDYEHSFEKDPLKLRILGLGDSIVFGAGVRYEDTYLRQLEKKLNAHNYNVEIIKAGVNSYEFDQQYTYFLEEGHKYHPDIVLVGVVLNDLKLSNISELSKSHGPDKRFFLKLKSAMRENCYTIRFFWRALSDIYRRIGYQGKDYNRIYFEKVYHLWEGDHWQEYKNRLLNLRSYLSKNNTKLILVIFPYTQQFKYSHNYGRMPQEKLIDFSNTVDISAIDLMPYLDVKNYKDYYLESDNVHLNKDGYRIVSDIIYGELKGILEGNAERL